MDDPQAPKPASPLPFWKVVTSVFAAVFGVQRKDNAQRDFTQGKLSTFILVGVGVTLFLVATIATIVSFVLSSVQTH